MLLGNANYCNLPNELNIEHGKRKEIEKERAFDFMSQQRDSVEFELGE